LVSLSVLSLESVALTSLNRFITHNIRLVCRSLCSLHVVIIEIIRVLCLSERSRAVYCSGLLEVDRGRLGIIHMLHWKLLGHQIILFMLDSDGSNLSLMCVCNSINPLTPS
jgi:hypothetical protein